MRDWRSTAGQVKRAIVSLCTSIRQNNKRFCVSVPYCPYLRTFSNDEPDHIFETDGIIE